MWSVAVAVEQTGSPILKRPRLSSSLPDIATGIRGPGVKWREDAASRAPMQLASPAISHFEQIAIFTEYTLAP